MNWKALTLNMSVWLVIAIALAFILDPVTFNIRVGSDDFGFDVNPSFVIMWLLVIQTTLSLHGFDFDRKKIVNRRAAIDSIILTYVVNTGITLVMSLLFLVGGYEETSYGFAMLAAMPCAISVITAAVFAHNDQDKAIRAVMYSYLAGLVLTPMISYLAIGDAVNPLEVFKYILMFIVIPAILATLFRNHGLNRTLRIAIINLVVAVIIFFCVNKSATNIIDNVGLTVMVFVVAFLRVLILHYIVKYYVIKRNIDADARTCYLVLGVWKTTGMAIAMCMLILGDFPLASIPCVLSVMIENLWFSWAIRKGELVFDGPFFNPRGFFRSHNDKV